MDESNYEPEGKIYDVNKIFVEQISKLFPDLKYKNWTDLNFLDDLNPYHFNSTNNDQILVERLRDLMSKEC